MFRRYPSFLAGRNSLVGLVRKEQDLEDRVIYDCDSES
jgi:hypothetical protein